MRELERRTRKLEAATAPVGCEIVIVIVEQGETEDEAMAKFKRDNPGTLDRAKLTYVLNFAGVS